MNPRRTLRAYAAQSLLLDASAQETFILRFRTSVESLRIKNISPGQLYCFVLKQDQKGKHRLNWGNTALNGMLLDPRPNSVTVQCFIGMSGQFLLAVPPGQWIEEEP
jgi:hypothetical protein